MASCEQITLAILAGGRGSRMGRPKAWLEINGQPILRYLLHRISWPGPRIVVTAPGLEHPPGADGLDQEFVDPEEAAGPLRGVLTALEHLRTPFVLLATVDMPDVTADLFHPLLDHLVGDPTSFGVMYRRTHQPGSGPVIEPFPLALRRESLALIRSQYQSSRRSVHALLDTPGFTTLPAPASLDVWTNLNTPGDLASWTRTR